MTFLREFRKELEEFTGQSDLRVFDALIAVIQQNGPVPEARIVEIEFSKLQENLSKSEARSVKLETLRRRVGRLNDALQEVSVSPSLGDKEVFEIRSRTENLEVV